MDNNVSHKHNLKTKNGTTILQTKLYFYVVHIWWDPKALVNGFGFHLELVLDVRFQDIDVFCPTVYCCF